MAAAVSDSREPTYQHPLSFEPSENWDDDFEFQSQIHASPPRYKPLQPHSPSPRSNNPDNTRRVSIARSSIAFEDWDAEDPGADGENVDEHEARKGPLFPASMASASSRFQSALASQRPSPPQSTTLHTPDPRFTHVEETENWDDDFEDPEYPRNHHDSPRSIRARNSIATRGGATRTPPRSPGNAKSRPVHHEVPSSDLQTREESWDSDSDDQGNNEDAEFGLRHRRDEEEDKTVTARSRRTAAAASSSYTSGAASTPRRSMPVVPPVPQLPTASSSSHQPPRSPSSRISMSFLQHPFSSSSPSPSPYRYTSGERNKPFPGSQQRSRSPATASLSSTSVFSLPTQASSTTHLRPRPASRASSSGTGNLALLPPSPPIHKERERRRLRKKSRPSNSRGREGVFELIDMAKTTGSGRDDEEDAGRRRYSVDEVDEEDEENVPPAASSTSSIPRAGSTSGGRTKFGGRDSSNSRSRSRSAAAAQRNPPTHPYGQHQQRAYPSPLSDMSMSPSSLEHAYGHTPPVPPPPQDDNLQSQNQHQLRQRREGMAAQGPVPFFPLPPSVPATPTRSSGGNNTASSNGLLSRIGSVKRWAGAGVQGMRRRAGSTTPMDVAASTYASSNTDSNTDLHSIAHAHTRTPKPRPRSSMSSFHNGNGVEVPPLPSSTREGQASSSKVGLDHVQDRVQSTPSAKIQARRHSTSTSPTSVLAKSGGGWFFRGNSSGSPSGRAGGGAVGLSRGASTRTTGSDSARSGNGRRRGGEGDGGDSEGRGQGGVGGWDGSQANFPVPKPKAKPTINNMNTTTPTPTPTKLIKRKSLGFVKLGMGGGGGDGMQGTPNAMGRGYVEVDGGGERQRRKSFSRFLRDSHSVSPGPGPESPYVLVDANMTPVPTSKSMSTSKEKGKEKEKEGSRGFLGSVRRISLVGVGRHKRSKSAALVSPPPSPSPSPSPSAAVGYGHPAASLSQLSLHSSNNNHVQQQQQHRHQSRIVSSASRRSSIAPQPRAPSRQSSMKRPRVSGEITAPLPSLSSSSLHLPLPSDIPTMRAETKTAVLLPPIELHPPSPPQTITPAAAVAGVILGGHGGGRGRASFDMQVFEDPSVSPPPLPSNANVENALNASTSTSNSGSDKNLNPTTPEMVPALLSPATSTSSIFFTPNSSPHPPSSPNKVRVRERARDTEKFGIGSSPGKTIPSTTSPTSLAAGLPTSPVQPLSASLGRTSLPAPTTPRRNSLGDLKSSRMQMGDLKIPARISQAQVGLKRDLGMVREFAKSVGDLKDLLETYNLLVGQLQTVLDSQPPTAVLLGPPHSAAGVDGVGSEDVHDTVQDPVKAKDNPKHQHDLAYTISPVSTPTPTPASPSTSFFAKIKSQARKGRARSNTVPSSSSASVIGEDAEDAPRSSLSVARSRPSTSSQRASFSRSRRSFSTAASREDVSSQTPSISQVHPLSTSASQPPSTYKDIATAFRTIHARYRMSWECAELLIELGGAGDDKSSTSGSGPRFGGELHGKARGKARKGKGTSVLDVFDGVGKEESWTERVGTAGSLEPTSTSPLSPHVTSSMLSQPSARLESQAQHVLANEGLMSAESRPYPRPLNQLHTTTTPNSPSSEKEEKGRDLSQRQLVLLREMLTSSRVGDAVVDGADVGVGEEHDRDDEESEEEAGNGDEEDEHHDAAEGPGRGEDYVNTEWRWGGVRNSTITLPSGEEEEEARKARRGEKARAKMEGGGADRVMEKGKEVGKGKKKGGMGRMAALRDMLRALRRSRVESGGSPSPAVSTVGVVNSRTPSDEQEKTNAPASPPLSYPAPTREQGVGRRIMSAAYQSTTSLAASLHSQSSASASASGCASASSVDKNAKKGGKAKSGYPVARMPPSAYRDAEKGKASPRRPSLASIFRIGSGGHSKTSGAATMVGVDVGPGEEGEDGARFDKLDSGATLRVHPQPHQAPPSRPKLDLPEDSDTGETPKPKTRVSRRSQGHSKPDHTNTPPLPLSPPFVLSSTTSAFTSHPYSNPNSNSYSSTNLHSHSRHSIVPKRSFGAASATVSASASSSSLYVNEQGHDQSYDQPTHLQGARVPRLSNVEEDIDDRPSAEKKEKVTSQRPSSSRSSKALGTPISTMKTGSVRSMPPHLSSSSHFTSQATSSSSPSGFTTVSNNTATQNSLTMTMTPENIRPLLENAREVHARLEECLGEVRRLLDGFGFVAV